MPGECSNPLPQCSADALREETLLWHCEHMALSLKKKQNKSELNLYYGMLYIKADRLGSSQGVKDAEAFFFLI